MPSPSELSTTKARINRDDNDLLVEWAKATNKSIAEIIHSILQDSFKLGVAEARIKLMEDVMKLTPTENMVTRICLENDPKQIPIISVTYPRIGSEFPRIINNSKDLIVNTLVVRR